MSFTKKQHQEFIEEVRLTIKTEFNGKIAALDEKLTKRLDAQDLAIAPVIDTFQNLKWGKNAVMGVLGFLAAVGGLVLLVIKIREKT